MPDTPCLLCHRRPVPPPQRTCAYCLGRVRTDLVRVEDWYALLPYELTGHGAASSPPDLTGVRGSHDGLIDAIVLIGAGMVAAPNPSRLGDRTHYADHLPSDPPSVIAILGSWEDDWRNCLKLRPAMNTATVTGSGRFLRENLQWAAHHHDAFDEFADDIRKLRGKLEAAMRIRLPNEHAYIPCPGCGGELAKRWDLPDPCLPGCTHLNGSDPVGRRGGHDQGGRRDDWHCRDRDCGRVVESTEYWLLVREAWAEREEREQVGA